MEGMSWRRISGWNGPYVYKSWLRLVCKDVYDMERFEETRQIAAEMLIELSGQLEKEIRGSAPLFLFASYLNPQKMKEHSVVF